MKILSLAIIILNFNLHASHDHIARRIVSMSTARLAHPVSSSASSKPITITSKPRTRTSELQKVDSPMRSNIHSKSTGEIPSISSMQECSNALESNQGAYSSSFSPATSPSKWVTPFIVRSPSLSGQLNMKPTDQPLTPEEKAIELKKKAEMLNEHDTELWRKMRYGHHRLQKKLQRSISVPTDLDVAHQTLSESMDEAANARLLARAVRTQNQTLLKVIEERKLLATLKQNIEDDKGRLSSILMRFEGLLSRHETLISTVENMTHDVSLLAQRVAALEGMAGPASPRSSIDYQRHSIDASKGPEKTRHRTGSSIRDMFGLGPKDN